ncbi:phage tail protein [Azospirillum sp. B4]|uniref:phage tail protein n=1 Tax=Azospirillum sp. B4 TaxID=95605 RepID=UPI00034ADE48|nr:phage tail protein [Azospirillum sp. B4]
MSGLFGGGKTNADTKPSYTGLQVQTSAAGLPIPLLWGTQRTAPNLFWYDDFTSRAVASDSGGGKGGGSKSTTQAYSCAVAMGLCEGAVASIGRVWADKDDTTLAKLNLTLFTGTADQAPFAALYAKHADQALAYPYTAYVASPSYDLGSSASLPNHNFEVQTNAVPRVGFDANPADILVDFLTNERYGVGLPADRIGDLTAWRAYCAASGLLLSPLLAEQEAASDIVNRWAQLTNTLIYWSGDKVQALPLGDEPLTGNGVTFTPDLTPVYDLADDDFIAGADDDPITLSRSDPADATNTAKVEYKDRENAYQTATAEVRDLAAIDAYGLRTGDPVQAHEICSAAAASAVATLVLQRQLYVRNTYQFKLAWTFALLEPGDIVTLTDAALGLDKFPVRITQIDEDEDGLLTFTAEELPAGIGTATLYPTPVTSNTPLNTGVDPGDLADPVIFEPSPGITGGVQQVWIGALGLSANWGGCSVWISADDLTYQRVGQITAPARLGVLGQDLAATGDAYVTLSTSRLQLGGGTAEDAAAARTLSLVGGEMLAYAGATLTGTATYRLGGLNRGLYGTGAVDHPAGTPFLRLDDAVFKYDLPAAYIGQPLYIKLTSFNIFQAAERSLADVDAFFYSPLGAIGTLAAPTGLTLATETSYLADGTVQLGIRARWTPADVGMVTDTVLRWGISGSGGVTSWQQTKAPAGATDTLLMPVVQAATYTVQAATSIGTDVRSVWGPAVSIAVGGVLDGASVTGLELYGQGLDTEFTGKDIHLVWRGNFPSTSADFGSEAFGAGSGFVNPYFQAYAVTVIEPDSGAVLRTDLVTDPEYFYLFDSMNAKDAGGPHRRLTFSVTIRDKLGGETAAETITVNNPVPASVQLQALANTLNTLFAFIAPVGDDALDFAGVNVWVGTSTTVDTSGVPAASGTTAPLVVSGLTPGATYYAVSQTFDTFGTAGCPITAPLQFQVPYLTSAQIAANTIGKDQLVLDLVSQIDLVTDGADVPGSVAAQIAAEAAQRVTAIQAEATARANAILASAQTLQAHIDTVSTAQQGTADSLASTTTTLTAAINGNAAAIQTEQTARVNGDSANASSITTLASEVHNPTTGLSAAFAAINSEATTRATADSANASATSALSAQVNDATTGLPKTRADLVTEQTTRANADSALSTSINNLSAQVNDSGTGLAKTRADLVTEQTTRADADSALSTSINNLSAQVNDSGTGLPKTRADLATEQTTRANADSALSTSITTLSAQVNDSGTGLPATYAGLQSEMTARANGDSANATAITNLTTTVNGNTASITTLQSSVNGLNAQYVLKLDVNGYVAGFGVANSGSTSTFVIRTDTFALVPPGSTVAQSPFFVTAAGQVVIHNGFIENLDAATITTGTLGNGVIYAGTINASQINSSSIGGKVFWATATGNNDGSAGLYLYGDGASLYITDGTRGRVVVGRNGAGTDYGIWTWDAAGNPVIVGGSLANNVVNTPQVQGGAVTNHAIANNSFTASLTSVYGGTMLIIFTAVFNDSHEGSQATLNVTNQGGAVLASVSAPGVFADNSARRSTYVLRLMVTAAAGAVITATLSKPSDMTFITPIMTISEFRV